jgi:ribosome maturation protein SDO1
MVTVDKATIVRLQRKGKEFEILVDPALAQKAKDDLKSGKDMDVSNILAVEDVFFDSKKGIRAGKKDFLPVFETADVLEVVKTILKEGRIYTTSDQREKQTKEKWDRIVALISMNAIDAKTKAPIPRKTIEDALHKAVFRINDAKKVEDQLQDAIKAAKKILPLSFEQKTIQLNNIPAHVAGKCLDICKKLGSVNKETWNADKSLTVVVAVPAGLNEEFVDKVNALTHGATDMKYI